MMLFRYKLIRIITYALFYIVLININGCSKESSKLKQIKSNGILRIALVADPPHYFPNKVKERGYDFELVSHYATSIDVELEIIKTNTSNEIIFLLNQGKVDIGILGSSPEFDQKNIENVVTYNNSKWYVIGNRANRQLPKSIDSIEPNTMIVANGSNASFMLHSIGEDYPSLLWDELKNTNVRSILERINENHSKISIISEDIYAYYQYLFPETKKIFVLPIKYPSRWLVKNNNNLSFLYSINSFFNKYKQNGKLEKIGKTYYEHLSAFDYVDIRYYLKRINKKLPKYKKYFVEAAKNSALDARIIAAVSYQESHWNRKARSPTGVRGMMMLTLDTAKRVGVKNRLNAKQSIFGGAKYLKILYESFSNTIEEPDRLWFTLAAYNIGLGHVEDARTITKSQGDNPNSWIDVEKHIPKLSQKKWYKKTKYGFARGHEPIEFVRRVRRYYDILCLYRQEGLF
jgi:membrane-bound lytic murein transglycosylase F